MGCAARAAPASSSQTTNTEAPSDSPDRERSRVRAFLQSLAIAYPDERFAATYGELFARITARGHTVNQMDLLIATAAVVDGVPLLTANQKHLAVVPDLRVVAYR